MDSVVVTLRSSQNEIDLELPTGVPLSLLVSILVEKLQWPELVAGPQTVFTGRIINRKLVVRPEETLAKAAVSDGDILELVAVIAQPPLDDVLPENSGLAALQCVATGRTFPCRGPTNLVGRLRHLPINLAPLPHSHAVSRTHANIIRRADGCWLKDEHSANGTFVDGYALKPGESVRIRHGSRLQFGQEGPVLVFLQGGS